MRQFYLCIFLLVSQYFVVYAQDTVRVLPSVKVDAQKLHVNVTSIVPVQRFSGKDLQRLNSFSVADAVKYFSGVSVKDYGGIGGLKTVSVRSLGANHTGVLYNGMILADAQNGQIDLGKFSLDNISEISLYNAQPTDLLQPARSFSYASVLSIKTFPPLMDTGKRAAFNAAFKTGSFGLISPSAMLRYRWNKKLYTSVNAGWQSANGNYPFSYANADSIVKARRKNSDTRAFRIEQETKYFFDENSCLDVSAYYYHSQRGLPRAVDPQNTFSSERLWDKNAFVQASWEKTFDKRNRLLLGGKYNYSYNRYLDPNSLSSGGKLENIFRQKEIYFTAAYTYQLSSFVQLAYAGDFFRNSLDADFFSPSVQFARPIRNTWLNNISARWQWKNWEATANLLSTTITNEVHYGDKPVNQQQYTPFVAVMYQPSEKIPLRFRAFYKDIFRMPTFNDLYYTQVGNTKLKPEFAKQYNIGCTWLQVFNSGCLQAFSLTADVYYNHVKDQIVALPRQNLFQWSMINYGRVDIKSMEAGAQLYFKSIRQWHFSLSGNYTFQQALDVTDNTSALYQSQIPYTPKNSGSLTVQVTHRNFSFGYNALFSGYRYIAGQNSDATLMPAWNTQDAVLTYHLPDIKLGSWSLVAAMNNLFNKQYEVVKYYPMPGRNFSITIKLSI